MNYNINELSNNFIFASLYKKNEKKKENNKF